MIIKQVKIGKRNYWYKSEDGGWSWRKFNNHPLHTYEVEVTDTYGGEANYCWVRRYTFKARTIRGAINKLALEYGSGWRKDYDGGDFARYNLTGACVCCFVKFKED